MSAKGTVDVRVFVKVWLGLLRVMDGYFVVRPLSQRPRGGSGKTSSWSVSREEKNEFWRSVPTDIYTLRSEKVSSRSVLLASCRLRVRVTRNIRFCVCTRRSQTDWLSRVARLRKGASGEYSKRTQFLVILVVIENRYVCVRIIDLSVLVSNIRGHQNKTWCFLPRPKVSSILS